MACRCGRSGPMLGEIRADLVERARRDPGAVAQPRRQLAVVDNQPPEGGFGRARLAAIVADFAKNLLGRRRRFRRLRVAVLRACRSLALLDPHGCLLRLSLPTSRDGRRIASTTNRVGRKLGHVPTRTFTARGARTPRSAPAASPG